MSSGGQRYVSGQVKGTGVALDVKTIGFRPERVKLWHEDGIQLEWNKSMADASGQKRIANGTGSTIAANGITPLADGFRIGTDAVNASGKLITWEVWG